MDRAAKLDRALDAMARGERPEALDPELRALVRLAILISESAEDLTPARRTALRARILRRLEEPRPPTRLERAAAALSLALRPLGLAGRTAVALLLVTVLAAGVTVAGERSLPGEPLYGWKLATEQVRLAVARAPEDIAAVQMSIAQRRLEEAGALATLEREAEADEAVSRYAEHVATAVAALTDAPSAGPPDHLVAGLQERLVEQQQGITAVRERLAAEGRAAPAALEALEEVASRVGGGQQVAATQIAEAAARTAERAAKRARERAVPASEPALGDRKVDDEDGRDSDDEGEDTNADHQRQQRDQQAKDEAERARQAREDAERASQQGKDEAELAREQQRDEATRAREQRKDEKAAEAAQKAAERARQQAEKVKEAAQKRGR